MSQSTTNNTRITILERFRGPPTSGHGGYVSGRFAAFADLTTDDSAEVTLRSPIPLDQSMSVLFDDDNPRNYQIQDSDTLIAEVRAVQLSLEVPDPPDWAQTLAAESRSAALMPNINPLLPGQQGFHPICFCCGPEHPEGLHIFVAPVDRQVSAIWETKTEWGDDAGKLYISSEGALTLLESADYETQSSYNVIISASDGSETVSESITIGVSNLIETPPSLTLPSTISVAENTSVVAQASATDPEGSAVTYALSGTDAATFYVSSTGLVSFRAAPDYESLNKTQYSLTVTVTNAGALSASGSMTVNVTDIVENFFDTCRFGDCRFE